MIGYVLKDEAKLTETQQMETWSRMMQEADPKRDCILVSQPGTTEGYSFETSLPVICTDIYFFGGDGSVNIPNPSSSSQRSYRGSIEALVDMTEKNGKKAWVMPQAFTEYWDYGTTTRTETRSLNRERTFIGKCPLRLRSDGRHGKRFAQAVEAWCILSFFQPRTNGSRR